MVLEGAGGRCGCCPCLIDRRVPLLGGGCWELCPRGGGGGGGAGQSSAEVDAAASKEVAD